MQSTPHTRAKKALKRGLRKNASGRYPLARSPLVAIKSLHVLARLLRLTPEGLRELASNPAYRRFVDKPGTPKERPIQEPLGATMRAHYRLTKLLDSIERPPYLHSATRRRSQVTNAEAHLLGPSRALVKTDIQKFYESTSEAHIKRFFLDDLGWARDLAKLMAKICTVDGHLPTGSCLSPILSYFVHRQTFNEVADICAASKVTMTLFVDDLCLSGEKATRALLFKVKGRISAAGLKTHKDKLVPPGAPGLVTGVVIDAGGTRLRNKHHKTIWDGIEAVERGVLDGIGTLRGQLGAATRIDRQAADVLQRRLDRAERSATSHDDADL